jgi:hypothetical protein
VSIGTAQQICNKLDHELGKVVDLLTPIVTAIEKANKAKQALRIISRYFSPQEMVKLSTALFYSRLYYGAKIWLSSALSATLKKKLWQTSSKMLKICQKDWQGQYSFKMLHKMSKRATPEMWSNYSTACGMYNVITTSVPEDTFVNLTENFLNSERNQGLQFTRSNRLKIGFNCLSNRLQKISFSLRNNSLQDSNVVFKMKCKKLFITDELAKF